MQSRVPLALLLFFAACGEPPSEPRRAPPIDPAELEQLAQLGYGDWSGKLAPTNLARSGVVRADPSRLEPGFNLYTSLPSREAHLLDMDGAVVHTWSAASDEGDAWHHVEMTDDGALFVLRNGPLEKIDWHSRPLWQAPMKAHHDLDVAPDGRIHVLGSRLRYVGERQLPIIEDEIVVLEPDGSPVRRIGFTEIFPETVSERALDPVAEFLEQYALRLVNAESLLARTGSPIDLFHANSIQLLDRDSPGLGHAGSALVTFRSLNRIAVIDLDAGRVTWSWGDEELERPHHARMLANGRISVFDNGWFREGSRVLRVARAGRITWQYPAQPGLTFFTRRRGAAQHLRNGNVLITESARGRVFEIAPDGELVWEFLNPQIDRDSQRRAQIYRMERVAADRVVPLLARVRDARSDR